MRTLYHFWLSPFARKVRVALAEKRIPFEGALERPWERRTEFLALNPAAEVPVLVDVNGAVICGGHSVCEYLEEAYPDTSLLGTTHAERAEVRRLVAWFDEKFNREVTENLVGEKLMRRLQKQGYPHPQAIRAGLTNIHYHLDYIAFLSEQRSWLAGERLTLADIAAAAHLSTVDYLGDVPWDQHAGAKNWYARIKCRPSFRSLLADRVPGTEPPPHYADLDF